MLETILALLFILALVTTIIYMFFGFCAWADGLIDGEYEHDHNDYYEGARHLLYLRGYARARRRHAIRKQRQQDRQRKADRHG